MEGLVSTALVATGTGSAAGLRPYFTVFFLGVAKLLIPADAPGAISGVITQIPDIVADPWVLGITGVLAAGEFLVDKFQFFDQAWDVIHSVLRPVFGALIGLQVGDEYGTTAMVTGAVLGGATATGVSLGRSTLRGLVNLLPEPVTNVLTSLGEDTAAVIVLIGVVAVPPLAALVGLVMLGIGIWLFVKLRRVFTAAKARLSGNGSTPARQGSGGAQRTDSTAPGRDEAPFTSMREILEAGASGAPAAGEPGSLPRRDEDRL
ncbi:DUF4126 domain-containing protein [Brevibacterium luteolum]|uniref:DUF4126 domain-containing protein n=1 Tax=Brevibacterium luteolum TaxID=199591 RepID=UPI00223A76F2|nr:DUF4126 domain-containing protein [Brevibacterium luteolum]MCT1657238.1 DUF4126 domain-containing protein [Brevibacterium luteolum]